jgi:hypothetical protein
MQIKHNHNALQQRNELLALALFETRQLTRGQRNK